MLDRNPRSLKFIKSSLPFLFLLFFVSGCINYKYSDSKTVEKLSKNGNSIEVVFYQTQNRNIRYIKAKSGNSNDTLIPKTAILFIHGSPGSSKDFKNYLNNPKLTQNAHLFAVDRPGYGSSDWGEVVTSIYDQCTMLTPLIDTLGSQYDTLIVVGHSYGGPVAAALPFMRPDAINKVMLIAPALDPKLEKIFWFSPLGKKKAITRCLTPKCLKMAADEKFSHKEALKELWTKLEGKSYNGEVIHVHGNNDNIVHYDNILFTKKRFRKVKIKTFEGGDHYIPFNEYERIVSTLFGMIRRNKSEDASQ